MRCALSNLYILLPRAYGATARPPPAAYKKTNTMLTNDQLLPQALRKEYRPTRRYLRPHPCCLYGWICVRKHSVSKQTHWFERGPVMLALTTGPLKLSSLCLLDVKPQRMVLAGLDVPVQRQNQKTSKQVSGVRRSGRGIPIPTTRMCCAAGRLDTQPQSPVTESAGQHTTLVTQTVTRRNKAIHDGTGTEGGDSIQVSHYTYVGTREKGSIEQRKQWRYRKTRGCEQ
jgi:hypothetical protein